MRMLGTIVVGMVALLGSSALAALPPVKQVSAVFEGCNYSIKSQPYEGGGPGGSTLVYYKIILQREQGPYNLCGLPPVTRELLDTGYREPELAIAASIQGIVVAYSWTTSSWSTGLSTQITVQRLNPYPPNPEVLDTLRQSTLVAYDFSSSSTRVMPSSLYLDRLKIHQGNLQVWGRLEGDWLTSEGAPAPVPLELYEGDHFISLYPDFFGTVQQPVFVTY